MPFIQMCLNVMSFNTIQVVDLFAGPGGLGEGFSSYSGKCGTRFKIKVSAEMNAAARQTLRLRAFYRSLKDDKTGMLDEYYRFLETDSIEKLSPEARKLWKKADDEALQIELGTDEGNARLDKALESLSTDKPWVLIGGPPCQAYSLVGRSRNKGNPEYRPEEDDRHFLYREYLRIIQTRKPTIFVMENVKGILSSKVSGDYIFPKILKDLAEPDRALGQPDSGLRYKIYSLVADDVYQEGMSAEDIVPNNYIIRSEDYGIPQARHRVILLGVLGNIKLDGVERRLKKESAPSVLDTIGKLPRLRSRITKCKDSPEVWAGAVYKHLISLAAHCNEMSGLENWKAIKARLYSYSESNFIKLETGGLKILKTDGEHGFTDTKLDDWLVDKKLPYWLNHETRGHMTSDLRRYVYAAVFAEVTGRSPKGGVDFKLPGLAPDHKSWKSGNFSDRFRVQLRNQPSTTITSHISKDGHYFIHYDPSQCRSLTVREAARLQTFPDNYFFLGGRTEQYHQVGNAVPPLLASKVAEVVANILFNVIQ